MLTIRYMAMLLENGEVTEGEVTSENTSIDKVIQIIEEILYARMLAMEEEDGGDA